MRNGQSLTILYSVDLSFRLFRDNCVSVKMKTPPVMADQNHSVLPKCANIDFRCGTRIKTTEIAQRNRWLLSLACQQHTLDTCEYFSQMILLGGTEFTV